jgi:hypothetical protein
MVKCCNYLHEPCDEIGVIPSERSERGIPITISSDFYFVHVIMRDYSNQF